MIQDVTDLKEKESGDASGAVDASVDWDAINASIRVKAWQGFKAGLYPQQDLRDVEQQLAEVVLFLGATRKLAPLTRRLQIEPA